MRNKINAIHCFKSYPIPQFQSIIRFSERHDFMTGHDIARMRNRKKNIESKLHYSNIVKCKKKKRKRKMSLKETKRKMFFPNTRKVYKQVEDTS